jgi:hypothetical protein
VHLLAELSQIAQLLCSDIEAAGQPQMQEWLLKRLLIFSQRTGKSIQRGMAASVSIAGR